MERCLRDERLEREREAARQGDRRPADGEGPAADGHINLFPEAKDAEVRLATGPGPGAAAAADARGADGVLPVPLGGDEAAKRQRGIVPFYARAGSYGDGSGYARAAGSFRLGDRRRGGSAAASDAITGKITSDQHKRREDDRKHKMDPMCRFFASTRSDRGGIPEGPVAAASFSKMGHSHVDEGDGGSNMIRSGDARGRKKAKERRSGAKRDRKKLSQLHHDESCSSGDNDSTSHHSSVKSDGRGKRSHLKERPRRREAHGKSRRRRSSSRRRPSSPNDEGAGKHADPVESRSNAQRSSNLEERRKKRRAREAREAARARRVLLLP